MPNKPGNPGAKLRCMLFEHVLCATHHEIMHPSRLQSCQSEHCWCCMPKPGCEQSMSGLAAVEAFMGPSGSGKTTLLSIIGSRAQK